MFIALDIKTKEVIAKSATRAKVAKLAEKKVGREGYCIRPAVEPKIELPKDWCTSDGQWWI